MAENAPYRRRRNLVRRQDGRPVNVARPRGQLFVCAENCCCGRVEDGFSRVPVELYHGEWERRRLRNLVHLTVGGCLGPCALANVALLLFNGQALWFHSMNSEPLVLALYDYIEQLLTAEDCAPPPPILAEHQFTASAWQARPDGQPVDDYRPRTQPAAFSIQHSAAMRAEEIGIVDTQQPATRNPEPGTRNPEPVDRLIANMDERTAVPRKNGELVFAEPWQGRAFGMAVTLNEESLYPWDDFRERLIAELGSAEARGDPFGYYERWLAALESVLQSKGIVSKAEIDERTYEFEFGERDDVY